MDHSVTYAKDEDKERLATKRRWEQIGAAGGIVFVMMQLMSQALIQIGGGEPPFDAPAADIGDFFMNRDVQLATIGGFLAAISIIPFLWFLGVLWARLRRYEGEPGWLSMVALVTGVTGAAVILGGGGGWELAILRIDEGLDVETLRLLFDQGNQSFATFWVALAGLLLAAGVVTIRDGGLPRWLGWMGLILAIAFLAVRSVWFTGPGVKFLPYMLFWVWLIAASVVLIRRAGDAAG
jgi:hypothetical protein